VTTTIRCIRCVTLIGSKSAALVSMFFEYHSEETGDATEVTTAGKNDPSFYGDTPST